MKAVVIAAALATSVASDDWESYKAMFNKAYETPKEEARRKKIFGEATKRIAKLNKINGEEVFGWTRETDRMDDEKHSKGAKRPAEPPLTATVKLAEKANAPAAVDWRGSAPVTPVKNQGQCGSCWAFSATETIESQFNLLGASDFDALSLSAQQITSCVTACDGCNGGWPYSAYEYVANLTKTGLSNDFYWPYAQSLIESSATKACTPAKLEVFTGPDATLAGSYATVTGWNYVIPECSSGACTSQDTAGLAAAVAEGPVSVCVNAGVWNDYTGGVMTQAACGDYSADALDHCVQLVGYNSTAASPYWIVRNSWATTFGEEGYILLEYPANTCGLANEATKPTIGNAPSKVVV